MYRQSTRKSILLLCCLFVAISAVFIQTVPARSGYYTQAAVYGATTGDDWKMFRHDNLRTGRSPFTGVSNPAKKWALSGVTAYSSPVIDGYGTVYVGGEDNKVYAVNPDGSKKWTFTTGAHVRSSGVISTNGTIYIGSDDGSLYALNSDGTMQWSFATGGKVYSSPAIGTDGTIYVGSAKGYLFALNPDGTKKWQCSVGSIGWSSPAIGSDGTIYIGSLNNNIYAVNPDGAKIWSWGTDGAIDSSPAIGSDGTVYVGSSDGSLHAIDSDGTYKWGFATGGYIDGSPAVSLDGTIYIGSSDGHLYAVNSDGTQKWVFATNDAIGSSPAIDADGTVYVGAGRSLYAVNPNGTKKWNFAVTFGVTSSPSIGADGTVYFGAYAVNLGSTTPPSVTITSPTTSDSYQSSTSSITIGGSASGPQPIASVTWLNAANGKTGTCTGTESWSASNIPLKLGINTITVIALDTAGMQGTRVLTVNFVDANSPKVTINTPDVNPYDTEAATVELTGTASDDIGVSKVTWANAATGESGTCTGTSSWSVAAIPLKIGTNAITITALDAAGNKGTAKTSIVSIDKDVPVVTITKPNADPYTTSDMSINIAGTASDNDAVTMVKCSNNRIGTLTCTGTKDWSYSNLPLKIGTNVITVSAWDKTLNKGTATFTVTVIDSTVPELTITTPDTNPFTTNASVVNIAGTASDDLAVTRLTWSNAANGQSGQCVGTASWNANSIPLNVGGNVITITAYDAADNHSTAMITVNYADNTSPSVKITSPSATGSFTTSEKTISISGTASDDAGVTAVIWSSDRGVNGTCTGTASWSASGIALKNGVNVITVTACDESGNTSEDILTVTLADSTPPTVTISSPTTDPTYSTKAAAIDLSGTASDSFEVTSVTWANSTGGSGTCTGTDTWSVTGIPLQLGQNVITITATDGSSNTSTDVITVTRNELDAPSIEISLPTTVDTYWTNNSVLNISGTASDDVAVTAVAWSNDRGGSGVCSGTTSWSQSGITLLPGQNVITVTASNGAGKTTSAILTVYYYDTSSVQWTTGILMVSLPIIPADIDPKPIVQFRSNAWFAYKNAENIYAVYPDEFTFFTTPEDTPGRGFWGKFDQDITVPVGALADQTKAATIHLVPGWNLVGQPFITPVNWDLNAILVQEPFDEPIAIGSSEQSAVAHIAWGWTQDSTNPNTGSYYLVYDPSIYPDAVGTLAPWQAYWVMAYRECDLILPAPEQPQQ